MADKKSPRELRIEFLKDGCKSYHWRREAPPRGTTCGICNTKCETEAKEVRKCGHFFHNGCLLPYLMENQMCPVCGIGLYNVFKFTIPPQPWAGTSEATEAKIGPPDAPLKTLRLDQKRDRGSLDGTHTHSPKFGQPSRAQMKAPGIQNHEAQSPCNKPEADTSAPGAIKGSRSFTFNQTHAVRIEENGDTSINGRKVVTKGKDLKKEDPPTLKYGIAGHTISINLGLDTPDDFRITITGDHVVESSVYGTQHVRVDKVTERGKELWKVRPA